ncbi:MULTISPECIES: hypothetical protein [unclassified Pseudomonas]|uniref:hypothetical protein n=1 Tax=unclassified Pseudomonas TaxID=196821 RepID=UPI00244CF3D3|nr:MULTISPECIES: hypothetical protein [unclassified Pseudomonas]MDG9925314.1 hypothetical protein [Pseudomonas sp. GD04045]MDH0036031.1 hypothetical protein [Pseudomonas sp. GD04019]
MLLLIKIALSLPIAYGLAYPFLHPGAGGGILKEVEMLGPVGSLIAVLLFLMLVALYCRDLQRALALVRPAARKAKPRSVWLMFLLPYNFIEDFFIVANLAGSLREEALHNERLKLSRDAGLVSGWGWCAAQVVSLIPHQLGSLAGLLAILLWVVHWRFVRQANAALALSPAAAS